MASDDDYRKKFNELFGKFKDNREAKAIDESTLKIIDHVHTRVAYTESKRKAILEVGLVFLTFPPAMGLLINYYSPQSLILYIPFIVSLIIVGLIDITLYLLQERFKRPFIEVAKTWRWFYHYCIDPELPAGPMLSHKKREKSKEGFLKGLFRYTKNTLDTTSKTRLRQDIEQLFILLTTERLKNEFLKQQQGVIFYGFISSLSALFSAVILPVYFSWFFPEDHSYISILFFIVVMIILFIWKVFRVTKSQEPWEQINELNGAV